MAGCSAHDSMPYSRSTNHCTKTENATKNKKKAQMDFDMHAPAYQSDSKLMFICWFIWNQKSQKASAIR